MIFIENSHKMHLTKYCNTKLIKDYCGKHMPLLITHINNFHLAHSKILANVQKIRLKANFQNIQTCYSIRWYCAVIVMSAVIPKFYPRNIVGLWKYCGTYTHL